MFVADIFDSINCFLYNKQYNKNEHIKTIKTSHRSFFADIIKEIKEGIIGFTDVKPDMTALYAEEEYGWSFLIPSDMSDGTMKYDMVRCIHLSRLPTNVKTDVLRRLISLVPEPSESRGWNIGTVYNIFIVDKFIGKFKRAFSLFKGRGEREYFYFFSSSLGINGIKARFLGLWGNHLGIRAEKIEKSMKKKKFNAYGYLCKVISFFRTISDKAKKISERIGWTKIKHLQNVQMKESVDKDKLRQVLTISKSISEEFYKDVSTMTSIHFPQYCRGMTSIGVGVG